MKARIVNGLVAEILVPVDGHSIEDCFHPDILAQCVDVTEGMKVGDVYPPVVEETTTTEETTDTTTTDTTTDTTTTDTTA